MYVAGNGNPNDSTVVFARVTYLLDASPASIARAIYSEYRDHTTT
jgi:hypothetical protein